MKIKSAFFVTNLNSGGIENYLLRFLKHYSSEISATVICKSGKIGEDLVTKYQEQGVIIIALELKYFNFYQYIKLYRYLKTQNFDSICDFTGNFAALTLLVAKKAGILKRVVFYRGSTNHFKETKFKLFYNKVMMYLVKKYATKILSNSIAALDFFYFDRDKNDKQFEVIYNGIDSYQFLVTKESLRSELKIPDTAFVAGHVGRFTEAKNHKTIIEVAIKLCRVNPNNFFILCGKDTDINLKVRIEREGLQKQIKLLGLRNDVIKVLNTLNCFYFPSLTEGQPNALIEALITGLPFVASNIDPVKETIPLAYHTQLIEPLDIELAVDKILKIKYDAGFARSLNLRDCAVSNYNPDVLFKKFFDKL